MLRGHNARARAAVARVRNSTTFPHSPGSVQTRLAHVVAPGGVSGQGDAFAVIVMTSERLVAELRGRQWVVRTVVGETVAWISPAGGAWSVSVFDGPAPAGRFTDPRDALEALTTATVER